MKEKRLFSHVSFTKKMKLKKEFEMQSGQILFIKKILYSHFFLVDVNSFMVKNSKESEASKCEI